MSEKNQQTQEEKYYVSIVRNGTCPNCSSKDSLGVVARGAGATNEVCTVCGAKYWIGMNTAEQQGFDYNYISSKES